MQIKNRYCQRESEREEEEEEEEERGGSERFPQMYCNMCMVLDTHSVVSIY
jgi:hypothetical protein